MIEKYAALMKNLEDTRRDLREVRSSMDVLKGQYEQDGARSREREAKLRNELEVLRNQFVDKDGQIALLSMENEVVKTSTMQAYTRGREEGAVSPVALFKDSREYATEVCLQGSSFYIDGFATCLKQFKNLRNLSPDFDLIFLNVRADGFGRVMGDGPSTG
ncbi:hypothetical protein Salat_0262000 [Sesamum alatum]|uniref:Uncharacterized protein n=1 Tax=Sesamum alatum TaxID=300844 RepID=A0AAE1YZM5_9LAMI|nr:hypothetical protein Salat_0262000 [Sesamum alatum]